jgi:hypothetical protein
LKKPKAPKNNPLQGTDLEAMIMKAGDAAIERMVEQSVVKPKGASADSVALQDQGSDKSQNSQEIMTLEDREFLYRSLLEDYRKEMRRDEEVEDDWEVVGFFNKIQAMRLTKERFQSSERVAGILKNYKKYTDSLNRKHL